MTLAPRRGRALARLWERSPSTNRGILAGPTRAQGFVLVAVLVVVMLASMVAMSLLFRINAEETASAAGSASEQAFAAAMSGVEEAMRVAATARPGSTEWLDDPAMFRERLVFDDGADRWYFTVFTQGNPQEDPLRYGLSDEAAKLNINLHATLATNLPGLPAGLTDALLDFIDADDTVRPDGAEQEYYDALPQPYRALNGPLSTLEELLLVRGFTPPVVYGEDANLNFQLDFNEDDSDESFPPDDGNGELNAGLRPWLTVSSYDLNQDNEGFLRTDLNDPEDPVYTNDLPANLEGYILALRSNKVTVAHAAELLEGKTKVKRDGQDIEIESGVTKENLATVLDWFSATNGYELPGLLNVNTASAQVLRCVPGLEETVADQIVSTRKNLAAEKRQSIAWLYEEGVLEAAPFKKVAPYLTARTFQYSFHVVGYGLPSRRYRVLEASIDTAGAKPTLLYLRDLTRLGLPFRLEGGTPTVTPTRAANFPSPTASISLSERGAKSL